MVPVFECFKKKFPAPEVLANASSGEILKCIKSLGLGKRALGMKQLAFQLVSNYEGKVPKTQKELLRLCGVGNYVSKAVLSCAFGESVPAVDVNFARVVKRVFSLKTGAEPQKDKMLLRFADMLFKYVEREFKIFNWGIIDFSNLLCTPKNPKCSICPLNSFCNHGLMILKSAHL